MVFRFPWLEISIHIIRPLIFDISFNKLVFSVRSNNKMISSTQSEFSFDFSLFPYIFVTDLLRFMFVKKVALLR